MASTRGAPSPGLVVAAASGAVLAGVALFAMAGAGGEHGVAGIVAFQEDGAGVARLGLAVLSLVGLSAALTCGSFFSAETPLSAAASAGCKLTLVVAVVFMFSFPDLSQFENKSLTLRAVFYPILAFAPVAYHVLRGRRQPYPFMADLCVSFAVTLDIVSNDLHWYGRWKHWDDSVHVVNSIPLMVLIATGILVVERRGVIRLGLGGAALFALCVYTTVHAFWEMYEFGMDRLFGTELQPGGMEEATRNNVAGIAGSAAAIALLYWWRLRGVLVDRVLEPIDSYLPGRSRSRT